MDIFEDKSTVNLDQDKDPNFDVSFGDNCSGENNDDSCDGEGNDVSCSGEDIDDSCSEEDFCIGDEKEKDTEEKVKVGELEKRILDLTADDILSLEFGSEELAFAFYESYAKALGFVVRKDDVKKDIRGQIIMRQYVFNKEGLRKKKHFMRLDRKRDHRPITRTKCNAKLRIHYHQRSSKWRVVSFEECHNHELTPAKFVHLIPAYRKMADADKAQVDSLHSFGVRTCHIMGYLVSRKGGYGGVGFTRKDLYNYLDCKTHMKIKDGDARAALSYLQGKADNGGTLVARYQNTRDVVTDGGGAMREAIRHVFPESLHHLCAWHLHNNACENVKHPAFLEDFKTAIWVSKTYENRRLWATAYLRDKFFGRIRTTSQCEAINSVIKVLFESRGIPCSHIISVMKNEHMEHIPSNLILSRWTKNAKRDVLYSSQSDETDDELGNTIRYSAFISACNSLFESGGKKRGCFSELVDDIHKLTLKYKTYGAQHSSQSDPAKNIGEPTMVKTKDDNELSIPADCEPEVRDCDDSMAQTNVSNDILSQNVKKDKGKGLQKTIVGRKRKQKNVKDNTIVSDKEHVSAKDKCSSGSKPINVEVHNLNEPQQSVNPGVQSVNPGFQSVNTGVHSINPRMQSIVPPIHIPAYGYGTYTHGVPMYPEMGGAPVYPQNIQIHIFPQVPQNQYFNSIPNVSSWNGLLQ
ncbi:FAR1 DNA-binding domain [Sesbania bispinosa]|nr:FAR1 DNA-binding domain [Sesbania bispinosa]